MAEAEKLIPEYRPDVVLTDIIMPDKEGIEIILELKRNYPELKIVAISGRGKLNSKELLNLAKAFGADRTLPKPFGPKEMLEAVEHALALETSPASLKRAE